MCFEQCSSPGNPTQSSPNSIQSSTAARMKKATALQNDMQSLVDISLIFYQRLPYAMVAQFNVLLCTLLLPPLLLPACQLSVSVLASALASLSQALLRSHGLLLLMCGCLSFYIRLTLCQQFAISQLAASVRWQLLFQQVFPGESSMLRKGFEQHHCLSANNLSLMLVKWPAYLSKERGTN